MDCKLLKCPFNNPFAWKCHLSLLKKNTPVHCEETSWTKLKKQTLLTCVVKKQKIARVQYMVASILFSNISTVSINSTFCRKDYTFPNIYQLYLFLLLPNLFHIFIYFFLYFQICSFWHLLSTSTTFKVKIHSFFSTYILLMLFILPCSSTFVQSLFVFYYHVL
jgi:hypothetical protein